MRSVRYYIQRSPVGELVVGVTPDGVCLVHWDDLSAAVGLLHRSYEYVQQVDLIASVGSQLDEYFAGDRRTFTLPLDLSLASPFGRTVLNELAMVPFGGLTTYGTLAAKVRSSPRAVGGAVGRNPIPIVIPCHRVVAAGGSIGGFSGGLERKYLLLQLEGHETQEIPPAEVRLTL